MMSRWGRRVAGKGGGALYMKANAAEQGGEPEALGLLAF